MKKCLYCDKPCAATSIFCDDCRALLLNRQRQRDTTSYSPQEPALPAFASIAQSAPSSVQMLHASAPPPLPAVPAQEDDLSHLMPEDWSKLALEAVNTDGNDPTDTIGAVDPLRQRRLPMRSASPGAESPGSMVTLQEPEQGPNAVKQEKRTALFPHARQANTRKKGMTRLQKVFAVLVLVALLALLSDGVLFTLNVFHHRNVSVLAVPAISVTPSIVQRGQVALLHLNHFTAHSSVFLTHDMQEMLLTETGSSLVQMGASGAASVPILIEPTWSLGSHIIEGEDVRTHYTTSATIQVINGEGHIPACSVTADRTNLTFTVTAGQAQPVVQSIRLNAGKCDAPERWQAAAFANWLTITPSSGQLAPGSGVSAIVQVSGRGLAAGELSGYIALSSAQQTQLVTIQLTVLPGSSSTTPGQQPTPTPTTSSSISYTVSPTSLNFTATEGQPDPSGQILTIANTGSADINWQAASIGASWLSVSPSQGNLSANQNTQAVVSVNAAQLPIGRYTAQLQVSAAGASGAQDVTVNVNVLAPCALHISPSGLTYYATTLQELTGPQPLTLADAGNCTQNVLWKASVDQTWVSLSSDSGSNGGTIMVSINKLLPLPKTYYAYITFSATSGGSSVQVSPQSVQVTLIVKLL
jgi:hypothetical protein